MGRKPFWIISLIFAFLLLFATIFYFLIFSPLTARYRTIIHLRDKYISILYGIRTSFGLHEADYCWYFMQPINPIGKATNGTYNYALIGQIEAVDATNNTITLRCSNGNDYTLKVKISTTFDPNWVAIYVGVNTKAKNPRQNPFMFYLPDLNLSGQKDPYFVKGQLYMAIWEDNRELPDIYKTMNQRPNDAVNSGGSMVTSILRY